MQYFSNNKNIKCAFSTKEDGNLSFKYPYEDVVENRKTFLKKINLDIQNIVAMSQPHDNKVLLAGSTDKGRGATDKDSWFVGYDGAVTTDNDVILAIETADCVPLFFYDEEKHAIGAAHAGWRGVLKDISTEMINSFVKHFDSDPKDIKVIIAPHITVANFEIREDVLPQFAKYPEFIHKKEDKYNIDLSLILTKQLTTAGVLSENIEVDPNCTFANDNFYSWRRDGDHQHGAMLGIITLKKQ